MNNPALEALDTLINNSYKISAIYAATAKHNTATDKEILKIERDNEVHIETIKRAL